MVRRRGSAGAGGSRVARRATLPRSPRRYAPRMAVSLSYDIVDVFTDEPYGGNPLAVVHGADDLSTEQLQALAREFNLSETAFPMAASPSDAAAGATYRLRIFTPVTELPFAGHPSVGTAWLLRKLGRVAPGEIVQACGAGLLPLELAADGGPVRLTGGQPYWGDPVDPAAGLAAAGLNSQDLDPVASARSCGVGINFLVVPVQHSALGRCDPDLSALRGFSHPVSDLTGVFVVSWDATTRTAYARMFTGDLNAAEDPATGSAAGAFGVWLAVSGLVGDGRQEFVVRQGLEMGRPSTLVCTVDSQTRVPSEVTISGDAVHIASGTITAPG